MHFHSQNLNDKAGGLQGSMWRHGRCWWSDNDGKQWNARAEWLFGSKHCRVGFEIDDGEDDFSVCFGLFFFFHFALSHPWLRRLTRFGKREVAFRINDWALWWTVWHDDNTWMRTDPWWKHGSFHFIDFIFGSTKYHERDLESKRVEIPMPEGVYPSTITLKESVWRRKRWPFGAWRRMVRSEVKPDEGIPVPGKGENSWDCGEDAIFGHYGPASTFHDAKISMIDSVLKTRRRYGGENWRPEKKHPQCA